MKEINLTAEMKKTVQRCIWFEPPEEAVKDTPRLAAYILTHGMPEDTQALRKQLTDDDLKQVLDVAPAGIYDARSWAYWNLVIGRYDTPPHSHSIFRLNPGNDSAYPLFCSIAVWKVLIYTCKLRASALLLNMRGHLSSY